MSNFDVLTTTAEDEADGGVQLEGHGPGYAHGPSDKQYVVVAIVLSLLTGIEVFTYFKSVINFGEILMPIMQEVGVTDLPEVYPADTFVSALTP